MEAEAGTDAAVLEVLETEPAVTEVVTAVVAPGVEAMLELDHQK
jgi:hypothetical protein